MIPGVQPYYSFKITDKDGNVLKKSRTLVCRSFVSNFASFMALMLTGNQTTYVDTSGTTRNWINYGVPVAQYDPGVFGSSLATDASYGIQIGSGTNAATINDYTLQTQISNASATHGATLYSTPAQDITSNYFSITRIFTNVSGGNLSINEIGFAISYPYAQLGYPSFAWEYADILLIRDVLLSTITLANTQTVTIQYTIKATI